MTRSSTQIAALLLPLCFVIACQEEPTTPAIIPSTPLSGLAALVTDIVVASVAVVPDSLLVFVGDQFKITAKPKNAAGQVLDRIARWTVATPSVAKALDSLKATVTFKALRVGTTSIKAAVDAKSRSAKVIVRAVTGAKVVVTPAVATVTSGKTLRFVATGLTPTGEKPAVNVTWTATGGKISTSGVLTAGTAPGTYRVIAKSRFGAADTSTVTITAAPVAVASVILVPATSSVAAGASIDFLAYGRTAAGDSVPVPVTYTATGGTIAGTGRYTAGAAAGTYRVIAKSGSGAADTAAVVISAAPIDRVVLLPDIAASRPGETTKFVATLRNTLGEIVPGTPTYETTCGSVTSAGVFTAPLGGSTCRITASVNGKADTTDLTLLPNNRHHGIPFGIFGLWTSSTTQASGVAGYTASYSYVAPSAIVSHIALARAKGLRLVLPMTGGSHDRYKTDGVFDMAKWQAAMNAYDTPVIRGAIAEGVADGTIVGNSVMDEPHQFDGNDPNNPSKSWGPVGTMSKARIDAMCAYVRSIFPTLPAGVIQDYAVFDTGNSYRVCDFIISTYSWRKMNGNVVAYRDAALAMAKRNGISIIFSISLLNGGIRNTQTKVCPIPLTGGYGTYSPNCRVTPEQLRDWSKVLGPAGCAMLGWRYDGAFMAKPENQAAISDVAMTFSQLPRRPCTADRAPNAPPIAVFASSCDNLTCSFTEESRDEDGTIISWSWDFGDGTSSTLRHPDHAYAVQGLYPVTLTVRDNGGAPGSVTHTVTVTAPPPVNVPPAAVFTASCTDLTCTFTDESRDDDGTVEEWSWDFGEGTSSTLRHPTHTYEAEGSFSVTLTVEDDKQAAGSVTQMVTVTAPPPPPPPPPPANVAPAAVFTVSCTDLACAFTDESGDEDGTVEEWSWNFGDGSSSTEPHPSHSYEVEGTYQVTLVVTDDDDATGTVTQDVAVTAPPAGP
jgi:PKD repeat protein